MTLSATCNCGSTTGVHKLGCPYKLPFANNAPNRTKVFGDEHRVCSCSRAPGEAHKPYCAYFPEPGIVRTARWYLDREITNLEKSSS